jgi:hypothetical protein
MFAVTQKAQVTLATFKPESKTLLSQEVYVSDFQFNHGFSKDYWTQHFYPNFSPKPSPRPSPYKVSFLKQVKPCRFDHINQQHTFPAWPRRCNITSSTPPTTIGKLLCDNLRPRYLLEPDWDRKHLCEDMLYDRPAERMCDADIGKSTEISTSAPIDIPGIGKTAREREEYLEYSRLLDKGSDSYKTQDNDNPKFMD